MAGPTPGRETLPGVPREGEPWGKPHRANPSLSAISLKPVFREDCPYGEVSELAEGTRLEIA